MYECKQQEYRIMSGESGNLPPNRTDEKAHEIASEQTTEETAQPAATPVAAQEQAPAQPETEDASTGETVRCALTGEEISADEAYWAPPLVTFQELASTVFTTLKNNPGDLGRVLFAEQQDVPYSPNARDELASRRTTEQLKLLGVLLLVLLVVGGLVYLIF
jgi:hypothetical protein